MELPALLLNPETIKKLFHKIKQTGAETHIICPSLTAPNVPLLVFIIQFSDKLLLRMCLSGQSLLYHVIMFWMD